MDIEKDSNREAFEAWFESRYGAHFMQFALDLDMYVDKHTQTSWEAWQAAKAQAVQEWISVDDEPPTPNKTFSDAVIAWDGICVRRIPLCLFNSASEVTHWMPIPQPPKAQEPANDL